MCQTKSTRFYLSSCRALVHCHQPHQKNPVSPSCALWQRSQPESERGRNLNLDVKATNCSNTVDVKGIQLPTPCITATTDLCAHSLGCRLPLEQKFSRRSSNSWRMALGIRERGWCLCDQSTCPHRELDEKRDQFWQHSGFQVGTGLQRKIQGRSKWEQC